MFESGILDVEARPLAFKERSQPREPGQRPKDADLLNVIRAR
jgi:hypothetical protein